MSVELPDRGHPIVLDLPNSLPIFHPIDFPKKTGSPMKCSMGRNDFANLHPNQLDRMRLGCVAVGLALAGSSFCELKPQLVPLQVALR